MNEDLLAIIGYLIGITLMIIFIIVMFFGGYWLDVWRCNQNFPDFEKKQNGFYARCLIKVNGQWIPSDKYRSVD